MRIIETCVAFAFRSFAITTLSSFVSPLKTKG